MEKRKNNRIIVEMIFSINPFPTLGFSRVFYSTSQWHQDCWSQQRSPLVPEVKIIENGKYKI